MNDDARNRIREAFEMIAPPKPTRYVPVRKKWLFFDVKDCCEECGHETLRLAWPWKTSYEPRWGTPVSWGSGGIMYEWIEPSLSYPLGDAP